MWGDAKFRSLSMTAKLMWIYLLTGPEVTSLPGAIIGGEAHFAEALGLELKAFREAFLEASRKGMAKADWSARLVLLPNAKKYNRPESPNVVKSWRDHYDCLPECKLKVEAYQALKDLVEGLGEAFRKAFAEAFAKGMPNQEQEQEQEQYQEQEQDISAAPTLANGVQHHQEKTSEEESKGGFDDFWSAYPRKQAKPAALKAWKKIKPSVGMVKTIIDAIAKHKKSHQWQEGIIPHPATWLNGHRWEDEILEEKVIREESIANRLARIRKENEEEKCRRSRDSMNGQPDTQPCSDSTGSQT